jgi:hypothetical protein
VWLLLLLLLLLLLQEEMDFAAAELEAVQSRLFALEAEKNSLAARLEANRQEAAASTEVRGQALGQGAAALLHVGTL